MQSNDVPGLRNPDPVLQIDGRDDGVRLPAVGRRTTDDHVPDDGLYDDRRDDGRRRLAAG
jgi:hypothetical protein